MKKNFLRFKFNTKTCKTLIKRLIIRYPFYHFFLNELLQFQFVIAGFHFLLDWALQMDQSAKGLR